MVQEYTFDIVSGINFLAMSKDVKPAFKEIRNRLGLNTAKLSSLLKKKN